MATSAKYSEFVIQIPKGEDLSVLKSLAKRLGWILSPMKYDACELSHEPNECTLKAMADARSGRVYHAKSAQDLINQILG